jgi:hypothetical protein
VAISLRGDTRSGGELDTLTRVDEELAEPAAAEHVRAQLDEAEEQRRLEREQADELRRRPIDEAEDP